MSNIVFLFSVSYIRTQFTIKLMDGEIVLKLSIVVPAYNEEESLELFVNEVNKQTEK